MKKSFIAGLAVPLLAAQAVAAHERSFLDSRLERILQTGPAETLSVGVDYREVDQGTRDRFRSALESRIRTFGDLSRELARLAEADRALLQERRNATGERDPTRAARGADRVEERLRERDERRAAVRDRLGALPALLTELAKVRLAGKNAGGAVETLDLALAGFEAREDFGEAYDDALALWAYIKLRQAPNERDGKESATEVLGRVGSYVTSQRQDWMGDQALPVLRAFLNGHQKRGRNLLLLLSEAAYLSRDRQDRELLQLARTCATAVLALIPDDSRAWLLRGTYEMSSLDPEIVRRGMESLEIGADLMEGSDTEPPRQYFLDPESYFKRHGMTGDLPRGRYELARYRANLMNAELWYGNAYLNRYGWDTQAGAFIVAHGPVAYVEQNPGGWEWSADSTQYIPKEVIGGKSRLQPSQYVPGEAVGGRERPQSFGAVTPRTTLLVSATGRSREVAKMGTDFGSETARNPFPKTKRGPQAAFDRLEAMSRELEEQTQYQDRASAYEDQREKIPGVFLAEYTSRSRDPFGRPRLESTLVFGIVPPEEAGPQWAHGRKIHVQEIRDGRVVSEVSKQVIGNNPKYRLPNGDEMYVLTGSLPDPSPGLHMLKIEVERDPGIRPVTIVAGVEVNLFQSDRLWISDFRRQLQVDGGPDAWVPSPVDRMIEKGAFRFTVDIHGFRPGPDGEAALATTFAVFRRDAYDTRVVPELARLRADGIGPFLPLSVGEGKLERGLHFAQAETSPGLTVIPTLKSDPEGTEESRHVGVGDGKRLQLDKVISTIDLGVEWLAPGKYCLLMEAVDRNRPGSRAFQMVRFIVTKPDSFLADPFVDFASLEGRN